MSPELLDYLVAFLVSLKFCLLVVSVIFVISGADEFFIDVMAIYYNIKTMLLRNKMGRLSDKSLFSKPEQMIALMIPCWD